jgi:NAD+ synthase (glutamine-hydrolysing)
MSELERIGPVRIALAQHDLPVGDIDGNTRRIAAAMKRAEDAGAQILALPELAITGYPPEDLVHRRSFTDASEAALASLAADSGNVVTVIGFVRREGELLYNSAAICQNGGVLGVYDKQLLPNYGVFDEARYFTPGNRHHLLETPAGVIGVCVCEDAWGPEGPLVSQGDAGAQVVVNINASPFHRDKQQERERMLCERARRAEASIAYVNMVGGQDELIFDGGSVVVDASGEVIARFPQFTEHFDVIDVPLGRSKGGHASSVQSIPVELPALGAPLPLPEMAPDASGTAEVYAALTLSLRDYVQKNGFTKVVIGLSGGIDSTLTAAICADALGGENVLGVSMPSSFSSQHSVDDAAQLADNLGMQMLTIPIRAPYDTYLQGLEAVFGPEKMGLAEENLQARIRGTLLMTISNRYGHLVIATGNKSEMACGYSTLYGDMVGGFALLKDVFKTEVYELARHRNSISPVIPENSISKPPSAELRPGQLDTDSLPDYDTLDRVLEAYIEQDMGAAEIVASGVPAEVVAKVTGLVDRAEYKRRQAPPGPKVSTKAFGRDRRLPITNSWRENP